MIKEIRIVVKKPNLDFYFFLGAKTRAVSHSVGTEREMTGSLKLHLVGVVRAQNKK